MKKHLFITLFIIITIGLPVYVHAMDDPIRIALIDANPVSDEIALGFQELFDANGCTSTIIQRYESTTTDFSPYDLIVISPSDPGPSPWQDSSAISDAIYQTELPIIGLGMSGYYFFGAYGLPIGWPNGMGTSDDSTQIMEPDAEYWHIPNPITVPDNAVLQLYGHSDCIICEMPDIAEGISTIGMSRRYSNYYSILNYKNHFLQWGFSAPVSSMTENGRALLINLIYYMADKSTNGPPAHWSFRSGTGNSATVVIPVESHPSIGEQLLESGDYIGAFTADSLCCGWIEWQEANAALTVWGDDDQTPDKDGFGFGELLLFRIFQAQSEVEYTDVLVTYSQGDGSYAPNSFLVLSQLNAQPEAAPLLFVSEDTLHFGNMKDTLSFNIENQGEGELAWTATVVPERPWLNDIVPSTGTGNAEILVMVDRQYLETSSDTTEIVIDSNDGNAVVTVIIEQVPDLPIHWNYSDETGNNATVILPTDASPTLNGAPLMPGDYVGVFTPDSLCCGWRQWTGENMAITVWGDNDQTPEIDGLQTGERLSYRVYRELAMQEWTDVAVTYSQGDGNYAANAMMVLSSFTAITPAFPELAVDPDTLNFNTTKDTLAFTIQNVGDGELNWVLSQPVPKDWLISLEPNSGVGPATVEVVVDRELLVMDADTATINVTSNAGDAYITVLIRRQPGPLPDHWSFASSTGTSATLVLPIEANPSLNNEPLAAGLYIGAFTPDGLCCGWKIWEQENLAITVWGDNDQTSALDGFRPLEQISYRVYDAATATEWSNVQVAYSQGDGLYAMNALMVLNQFNVMPTAIDQLTNTIMPTDFQLKQNYPNPFNPKTHIEYSVPEVSNVQIGIFSVTGQLVRILVQNEHQPGRYTTTWDGRDEAGRMMSSGLYLYRMQVDNRIVTRKLMLMK